MDTSATEYSVVQVIHLPLDLPLGCLWLSGQSAELSAQVCVHFSLDSIAQHTQSFLGFGQSGITGLPPTLYSCMLLQNIKSVLGTHISHCSIGKEVGGMDSSFCSAWKFYDQRSTCLTKLNEH